MPNVFDAAQAILHLFRRADALPITTWKLQKLVFYSQAWSLVWEDRQLFANRIEAWANGPVCPDLYSMHRGLFKIAELNVGDRNELRRDQLDTVKVIYKHYGNKTPQYLSELTHRERPWKDARRGLAPGEPSDREITQEAMAEYYGAL